MTTRTGRTLTLHMPLPPRELNPNGSRGHWSKHARAAADYRALCNWNGYQLRRREWDAIPVYFARLSLRFVWCTGRRAWDADNALSAAKPLVDSLRDQGVLRDDGAKRVTYGGIESIHCPPKCHCGGRVEVVIQELEA